MAIKKKCLTKGKPHYIIFSLRVWSQYKRRAKIRWSTKIVGAVGVVTFFIEKKSTLQWVGFQYKLHSIERRFYTMNHSVHYAICCKRGKMQWNQQLNHRFKDAELFCFKWFVSLFPGLQLLFKFILSPTSIRLIIVISIKKLTYFQRNKMEWYKCKVSICSILRRQKYWHKNND